VPDSQASSPQQLLVESGPAEIHLRPTYPASGVVPTIYSNLVGLVSMGEDIYLEICQAQPQTVKDGVIEAPVLSRVVISKNHAQRLLGVLTKVLSGADKSAQEDEHA